MKNGKTKTIVLLVLILAAGLLIRIVNISHTPPGVYPDEAVNGLDALNALTHGKWQWFYEANNGREGLFMNLIALCFKFLGVSVLSLKLPSIIFGTLTILGTYLLGKELFNRRVGLISSFLVATAFWAINFSRISFRANTLPTILVFSFYFLWKGLRTRKWLDFALGGLIFGLGLHTYIAFRIAPAILVVVLATLIVNRRGFLKEYWKHIAVFSVFTLLAAAPMLYTFYQHPEYIQSRTSEISVLNPEVNQGHLFLALGRSVGLSLVKYNIWGDQNWRHNYPPYAILDPVTGIAFTFGFIYVLLRCLHLWSLRFLRNERHPRLETYTFLLAWFFIMLVPEFLTVEGNPHALRSIGTLPAVFLLSALTFEFFLWKSYHHSRFFQKMTFSIITVILLFIGVFNTVKYHFFWANQKKTAESFDQNLMDASRYLDTIPPTQEVFVITESMQRVPIQVFHWGEKNISYVYPGEITNITPLRSDHFEILFTDRNDEAIAALQEKFPGLTLEEKTDRFGLSFYILK